MDTQWSEWVNLLLRWAHVIAGISWIGQTYLFNWMEKTMRTEVEANLQLWNDLYAADFDQKAAWAGLLSVLLRDPDFLFY